MGGRQSASSKPLEPSRVQYLCISIKVRLQEMKRQREDQIARKQQEFVAAIRCTYPPRNTTQELHQLSLIIEHILFCHAAQAIIQKTEVIKDYAHVISRSSGSLSEIQDMLPIIENICWSNAIFGMDAIREFQDELTSYFGVALSNGIQNMKCVDERVRRALAPAIVASYDDLNACANEIAVKFNLDIQEINGPNNSVHSFNCNLYAIGQVYVVGGGQNINIYAAAPPISTCRGNTEAIQYQEGFQFNQNQAFPTTGTSCNGVGIGGGGAIYGAPTNQCTSESNFIPKNHYESSHLAETRLKRIANEEKGKKAKGNGIGFCC